jgi:hypothetical protein
VSRRQSYTVAECRRALWLLGVVPPTDSKGVLVAWRKRVAQTHPDRHLGDAAREEAAAKLTRALNEAREVLDWWIAQERDWPPLGSGPQQVRLDESEPEAWPEREQETVAPVDPITGLRAGDRVRAWPYDGDLLTVVETEMDVRDHSSWVRVAEQAQAIKSDRIRLAAFSCPTCGACAGPLVDDAEVRPCPDCLIDLRRLEKSPADAGRIRRAIEARATAGESEAESIGDGRFADRARERRRWAKRLITAKPDDLHMALLSAFGSAWARWGEKPADEYRR